jgi:hypothetical protein
VNMGSRLKSSFIRAGSMLSRLKKSEVAEALIATWCVEFLRVRKVGGFNVVEIVVISVLMLGVKTIITEASRRRYSDKNRTFVMQSRATQVDPLAVRKHSFKTRKHGSHGFRRRRPETGD